MAHAVKVLARIEVFLEEITADLEEEMIVIPNQLAAMQNHLVEALLI